jgi:hypothetical protein
MFSSYIILSLTFLCVITYGYCAWKWFKLWWPDQSYSAHALFLGNAVMLIFAGLAFAQSFYSVFSPSGREYSPFTMALIIVIFIHALIQLALAQGYFARKE